jgi:hypothetical protein
MRTLVEMTADDGLVLVLSAYKPSRARGLRSAVSLASFLRDADVEELSMTYRCWIQTLAAICITLPLCNTSLAQVEQATRSVTVNGHNGEAAIVTVNGRTYVELESLARVGKGAMSFHNDQISLTFPSSGEDSTDSPPPPEPVSQSALSQKFMVAGIETIAQMREWATTLGYAIQQGYGVNEKWVADYREQAAHSLRLATAAASTNSDQDALRLLNNEFHSVREWSDRLLAAKQSMDTAKYTSSPNALRDEPLSQKIIACGHFLGGMLASAEFKDDPSCH